MKHQVVRTRKGALAMRNLEVDEVMHPGVGPLVEAERLYVRQSRLPERLWEGHVVVFDVGMGAGSNALAARNAALAAPGDSVVLDLVSFERDLDALTVALGQPEAFGLQGESGEAARAVLACGRHDHARVRWQLRHGDLLQALATESSRADIVFWDPFSPKANPDLWTVGAFTAIRRVAGPRCTLFTYSASTTVRMALLLAGWSVGVGDAIGDKAHTTAAAVDVTDLANPLDDRWLSRLSRPDLRPPVDAPADAAERVRVLPQFGCWTTKKNREQEGSCSRSKGRS
jgi:queuine tRNA-ribosyltransferase